MLSVRTSGLHRTLALAGEVAGAVGRPKAIPDRLGAALQRRTVRSPWTNVYGLGRSLMALGTLAVMLANDPRIFVDHGTIGSIRACSGLATLSLFCHTPAHGNEWARALAIVILLAAASGWRPRLTSIPYWWITFSVATSIIVEDGGDQAATILALLLIPVALGDKRRWVWTAPESPKTDASMQGIVATAAMLAIRVQVSAIYFQAFTAKLAVPEWRNGTAVYYYLHNPIVGVPAWLRPVVNTILDNQAGVRILTWGTLVTECALFMCLFLPRKVTHRLLYTGILLHLLFAVLMGLPSFSIIMWGALVLYLRDWSTPFHVKFPASLGLPSALGGWVLGQGPKVRRGMAHAPGTGARRASPRGREHAGRRGRPTRR